MKPRETCYNFSRRSFLFKGKFDLTIIVIRVTIRVHRVHFLMGGRLFWGILRLCTLNYISFASANIIGRLFTTKILSENNISSFFGVISYKNKA